MAERTIALVLIVRTNAQDGFLDDLVSHVSEYALPSNYKDEEGVWLEYQPTGSHWEEVYVTPSGRVLTARDIDRSADQTANHVED